MATSIHSLNLILSSAGETELFGYTIGRLLHRGEVLALIGELGAGKTALVRGIVAGLDAPAASVTSPTFLIVHEYQGRLPIVHIDWYRLQRLEETESIGLADYLTEETVVAIEWADRFPQLLPEDRLEVEIAHRTRTTRRARVEARGPRSRLLLARIRKMIRPVPQSARPRLRDARKTSPR
ncbi:MAG: tRNA (adenosine(37)-N6)-threonylcarbamoyltransferase complex ATPase subunit type 1 TsaE [Nitrospira sp.]|jgi:tRNA threonylcarbamoyladenosine biosynthesis protein TsaE|nr:tRNA (adenosine(37)-N6)-threonylcarbamoyltransferase complex ATPase subunit type 1 TsaE [Nitrospira sp.]MDI3465329.1 tRNA threonylcarbamoyladenosine biosynthesis protein TsaE [Nitrospira sp.]